MSEVKKKHKYLKRPKTCREDCALFGRKMRHRHYTLEYAPTGCFNEFSNEEGQYVFDGPTWEAYIKSGKVYRGYWPVLIFGTAKPVGLTPQQVKLHMAITRELTRLARNPRPCATNGAGGSMSRSMLTARTAPRSSTATRCMTAATPARKSPARNSIPISSTSVFCGNYRRHRGHGYKLATWMDRAGYGDPNPAGIKSFLADLAVLADKFDLTVVGRHHSLRQWYDLSRLSELVDTRAGLHRLTQLVMIRIYAPSDFLTLWRYRFSKWLGFSWILGGEEIPYRVEPPTFGQVNNAMELMTWLREHGVTRKALADVAGLHPKTLTRHLRHGFGTQKFWQKVNAALAKGTLQVRAGRAKGHSRCATATPERTSEVTFAIVRPASFSAILAVFVHLQDTNNGARSSLSLLPRPDFMRRGADSSPLSAHKGSRPAKPRPKAAAASPPSRRRPRVPGVAGITGQSEGAVPGTNLFVTQYYCMQILDFDQAVDHRTIGQVAEGGQAARLGAAVTSATETLAPLVEWGRLLTGSDHQRSPGGGKENGDGYGPPARPSQLVSNQVCSAARASLRRVKGPRAGPLTGERSAHQRPCWSGSTCDARAMAGLPSAVRSICSP